MKICLTQRVRRFLLSCFIAGITVAGSSASHAVDVNFDPKTDVAPLDSTVNGFDQWCGWGTHDSGPLAVAALSATSQQVKEIKEISDVTEACQAIEADEKNQANAPESSAVLDALFAVAESVSRRSRVSIQQMIEPFAMVAPYAQSSLEEISRLQQMAEKSSSTHDAVASSDNEAEADEVSSYEGTLPAPRVNTPEDHGADDLATADEDRSDLESLAVEEPIDVDAPGHQADDLLSSSYVMATPPPKSEASIGSAVDEILSSEPASNESVADDLKSDALPEAEVEVAEVEVAEVEVAEVEVAEVEVAEVEVAEVEVA
ncbi:secreted protein, partial [Rhodopirellula maiorica SM1]